MTKTRKNIKKCLLNTLTIPKRDGFYMPAEFEKQTATWLGWPSNPGTFRLEKAQFAIEQVARIISKYQIVHIVAPPSAWYDAYQRFKDCKNIYVIELHSNDNWLRDIAPTFLVKNSGKNIYLRSVGWKFNGWGKPNKILHDKDALVSIKVSNFLSVPFYEKFDFVCEGGAFSVDGKGTLVTTKQCLLNPNRNKKE
jgi:agmatine deiminase